MQWILEVVGRFGAKATGSVGGDCRRRAHRPLCWVELGEGPFGSALGPFRGESTGVASVVCAEAVSFSGGYGSGAISNVLGYGRAWGVIYPDVSGV